MKLSETKSFEHMGTYVDRHGQADTYYDPVNRRGYSVYKKLGKFREVDCSVKPISEFGEFKNFEEEN